MKHILKKFHLGAAWLLRNSPEFRGKGRLARQLHRRLLTCLSGADAIRSFQMRDNTLMTVDLRSVTEWPAFYSGRYDDLLSTILCLLPKSGMVLDVGANIGFYTIPLGIALQSFGGTCVAFEPVTSNYDRLLDNIRINELSDTVRAFPLALGDRNQEAVMLLDDLNGAMTGNAALVANTDLHDGQRERKPVVTRMVRLDDCVGELGLHDLPCHFIKVDIEGSEPFFFRGAVQFIRSNHPLVLAEVNSVWLARNGLSAQDYREVFGPEGYAFFLWRKGWTEISNLSVLASHPQIESLLIVPPEFDKARLTRLLQ